MGIPNNLVVHNLIPGTGSYFYTDKRIQLKNTSTAKLRRRQAVEWCEVRRRVLYKICKKVYFPRARAARARCVGDFNRYQER